MKTDILSPKDLFQKDVRYTIPPFQRPYVWSHDEQWEPLWDDVRNVAENYLDEFHRLEQDSVKAMEHTAPHFLGAVVLKQVPTPAKDIEQRDVIDGQQRVTTIQLLLDAMQQVCEDLKLSSTATRLSKLVINDKDLIGDHGHYIFKLWPTTTDREAFRHAMDNGLAIEDFEESLIVQAHEFFQLQVREWLVDDTAPIDHKIDALETSATSMLHMVVIDLSGQDDPNVIFETLNARGTPLEQSDLIKNFVLSQAGDSQPDVWGTLGDVWWREETRQGRLLRPRLDMLVNYWLAMRLGKEVPPSRVFDSFRSHVANRNIVEVMSELKSDLENYRHFETGRRSGEEDQFHYRTGVMQAGVITPVLLLLLATGNDTRIHAFNALESFLIRRMICRFTTKDYNRLILELAVRIQQDSLERAHEIVCAFLKGQTAYARKWPNDHEVTEALKSSAIYRLLTRGRLRLVLEGIETRLRSEKTEQLEVPRGLTIEHLMPQSWRSKWPLPDGSDDELAEHQRNDLVQSMGNLTMATQKLNSAMANAPWGVKRTELLQHSMLLLNRELITISDWNEESIRDRSVKMAGIVSEYWPGPDSRVWESPSRHQMRAGPCSSLHGCARVDHTP